LVGDADLAEGGLLQREVDDEGLDLGRGPVGQQRLLAAQLLQREFAAGLVELLEAVEAVARVAHHLAGLAHVAELLGELEQAQLGPDNLLLLGHGSVSPLERRGRALRTPTAPRPASALASASRHRLSDQVLTTSIWPIATRIRHLLAENILREAVLRVFKDCVVRLWRKVLGKRGQKGH